MDDYGVVGAVFGNVSTTEFRFAVRDASLKRLDYVQVEHPTDGALVAQVVEVTRETNVSFDQVTGSASAAPSRDHLVGRARVIGFRDARGLLQAPRTPVPAGVDVRRVDQGLLAHVFGLRDTEGAYLGVVKGYDLRVVLDINTLVQKHVSILAKTGSGKSYAVGVLMEELIKKGVPVVVIDPHGEHGSLGQPNNSPHDQPARRRFAVTPRNYAEHLVEYSPDTSANPDAVPFALESRNLEARDVAELLGGSPTNSQVGILHAAVKSLREREEEYDLVTLLEEVRESASNAKWNLVSALETLTGLSVFAGKGTAIESLVQPKKVSILNLKGVSPDVQQMVVAITARRLFEARKLGKVPPFMLVVEEAHNFCPERGMATTSAGAVMRTVASEGRKFGMGLMVVSQRPAKVDKNVLSQCNTQVILKVTNPHDLKALAASVEGLTGDSEDEIQRLPVGVAFVSHPRISIPVLVEIRPRETSHGGESVDVMASVKDAEPPRGRDGTAAPGLPDAGRERNENEEEKDGREEEKDEWEDDATGEEGAADLPLGPTRTPPAPSAPRAGRDAPPVPPSAPLARVPVQRTPPWTDRLHAELRVVEAADLDALPTEHLRTLEGELSARARDFARSLPEAGPRAGGLMARLNAQLVLIHRILQARADGEGKLMRRVRVRHEKELEP